MVLSAVWRIRRKAGTGRWGVRKLQGLVNAELASMGIRMGRDKLFALLRENNMLVTKRKRRHFTTQSFHWLRKYDNLVQDKGITAANQLWVSDITYVKTMNGIDYFLYLITDAYSQKIVGWRLSGDLKAASAVQALKMALKRNKSRLDHLIHHSDRGVQYCSEEYVGMLKKHGIKISMARPGSPQENAIAERVNGILKEEWLYDQDYGSLKDGRRKIMKAINVYNTYRPHNTLNNMTPGQIHDRGFKRHKAVRVIGKTYKYKKRDHKTGPSNKPLRFTGNDYSSGSCSPAELPSASSLHNKAEKL